MQGVLLFIRRLRHRGVNINDIFFYVRLHNSDKNLVSISENVSYPVANIHNLFIFFYSLREKGIRITSAWVIGDHQATPFSAQARFKRTVYLENCHVITGSSWTSVAEKECGKYSTATVCQIQRSGKSGAVPTCHSCTKWTSDWTLYTTTHPVISRLTGHVQATFLFAVTSGQDYNCLFIVFNLIDFYVCVFLLIYNIL